MESQAKTLEQELSEIPTELLKKINEQFFKNFEAFETLADQIGWEHINSSPSLINVSRAVGILNDLIAPFKVEVMKRDVIRVNGVEYFTNGHMKLNFLPTPLDATDQENGHE